MKNLEDTKNQIEQIEKDIADYPFWGAWLTVKNEELNGLKRHLAYLESKNV
tara:strand:- start:2554 stop:2706 length:153 start_codon:yes stop_codon:yes gene_type:complete